MHPSGSYIRTAIEDVRLLLNEASLDAKYDDSYLTRTVLCQQMGNMLSRINGLSDTRVYARFVINVAQGTEFYLLPSYIQSVVRLIEKDDDGNITYDWVPKNEFHRNGPGWVIEGNTIRFTPLPSEDVELEIWYVPSGFVNMHYATDGTASFVTTPTQLNLSAAPAMGLMGRNENEYVGCMLRVLDPSRYHAERIIATYDAVTRDATLRLPLPTLTAATGIIYEVVPGWTLPFWGAIASGAALRLATGRKVTGSHYGMLKEQYANDMKTLRDTLFAMQERVPKVVERNTIDNPLSTIAFE